VQDVAVLQDPLGLGLESAFLHLVRRAECLKSRSLGSADPELPMNNMVGPVLPEHRHQTLAALTTLSFYDGMFPLALFFREGELLLVLLLRVEP
jgi:hypothetical protein